MKLRYDVDLTESVVNLCVSAGGKNFPPKQIVRFQLERERLYAISDMEERNAAFVRLYFKWFQEWGFERQLLPMIDEFPMIATSLRLLAFRKARNAADEGAELFVNDESGRNAVVALRPSRLVGNPEWEAFFRHELTHLHDMLDPGYGYSREIPGSALGAGHQRLIRDRYRLLWDISIDGRITRSRHAATAGCKQHWAEFQRAYAFWPEERQSDVFNALWNATSPRHEDLMRWAADPRETHGKKGPLPGSPCPLCSFPTFEWGNSQAFAPGVERRIQQHFPHWRREDGICRRCAEIYDMPPMEYPATLMPASIF